jgi:hypothetical protein
MGCVGNLALRTHADRKENLFALVRGYGREPISVGLNCLLGILFRPRASVAKTSYARQVSKPLAGLELKIIERERATYDANQCSLGDDATAGRDIY